MARPELPSSVDTLQELVLQQQSTIVQQAERIALLEEWKRLITSQRFASRSEKIPAEQGHLFNEAELDALGFDEALPSLPTSVRHHPTH